MIRSQWHLLTCFATVFNFLPNQYSAILAWGHAIIAQGKTEHHVLKYALVSQSRDLAYKKILPIAGRLFTCISIQPSVFYHCFSSTRGRRVAGAYPSSFGVECEVTLWTSHHHIAEPHSTRVQQPLLVTHEDHLELLLHRHKENMQTLRTESWWVWIEPATFFALNGTSSVFTGSFIKCLSSRVWWVM